MRTRRHLWSGDSITEGYGDDVPVSTYGFTQRMNPSYSAGVPSDWHINFGCSGFMVPEYVRRARGAIAASPESIASVFCSAWSPNKPANSADNWAYLDENLDTMISTLLNFEQFLLERSIVFVPVFIENPPYPMGASSGARVKLLEYFFPKLTANWPWWLNLQPATQDPAITDGPQMEYAGPGDGTHPTTAQYAAIASYAMADSGNGKSRWLTAFEAAATYYGFTG